VFALMGADPEITIDEYEQVPIDQRDPNWVAGVASMARACTLQVFADNRDRMIDIMINRASKLTDINMSREEVTKAALDGIRKAIVAEERESLSTV
jgi:hypothetical protein